MVSKMHKKVVIVLSLLLLSAGCDKSSSQQSCAISTIVCHCECSRSNLTQGKDCFVGCTPRNDTRYDYSHQLRIGTKTLLVEIADTNSKWQQGLSDRNSMDENNGMLFDFKNTAPLSPSFWMKDMKFNLDVIWIYKNKIIGITPDVPAPSIENLKLKIENLPLYSPPSPVDSVLEVNAGWSKKNSVLVGDEVQLK